MQAANNKHTTNDSGSLGPWSPGALDDDDDDMSADGQTARGGKKRRRRLPAWLNHFNGHDLKIFARCLCAVWVATILIFIGPVLGNVGVATFFGTLLLFIVPPASVLAVYLLGSLSLLLGMCTAWAWGLLTMKAAQAARPAHQTQAKLVALKQQAAALAKQSGRRVELEAQILVHNGFMLDTRVTVIFFVMSCFFVYVVSRLRCRNPKFTLFQLFGIIITDLFLLFGPSLPSFTPTLAEVLVKPGAIGIGLGAACCLLLFPQSTSYSVLGSMQKIVSMTQKSLDYTRAHFAEQDMSVAELRGTTATIIAVYKGMQPALAFLPLDFSRGRWNADDVKSLHSPLRELMLAAGSLIDHNVVIVQSAQQMGIKEASSVDSEKTLEQPRNLDRQQSASFMDALRMPEQAPMRTLSALEETTRPLLDTCSQSIKLVSHCIHTVNTRRWINQPSQQTFVDLAQQLRDSLETLRATRATCVTETTEAIIETHKHLFDETGHLIAKQESPKLPGIVICMVLEERILRMATAIEKMLDRMLRLMETRNSHRIWIPFRLQYAVSWLLSSKAAYPVNTDGVAQSPNNPDVETDSISSQEQVTEARRRLHAARGHGGLPRHRSIVSRALVATYQWLTDPAGLYALRMTVATIATSIPAVIPHSAGFFYREKGIWGVITAQTTLLVYMADFTFSLCSRAVGTVVGGLMGTVAWYIGAGNGPGNPYGLAAICAVMLAILMWCRLFMPPSLAQATIMSGATFILVIGFSYDEDHTSSYGLPGKGYTAFWKRLVTVLLGFIASLFVQMLPKPPSATTHVRKTLAKTLRTLADHYALVLSHWGRGDANSPLGAVAEDLALEVAETLLSLSGPIALLKVELSFGPFEQRSLKAAQEQCHYMNQALGRLLGLSASLPQHLQTRLAFAANFLDQTVVGDNMCLLGLIEQTLRTGCPLPDVLPTPLVKRFFESWMADKRMAMLSVDMVRDDNYRRYCVALSAYVKFLSTIDELVVVLKEAVGVCHVVHPEVV